MDDAACPPREIIKRLASGRLESLLAQQLAEHISGCEHCESLFDQLQATDPLLCSLRECSSTTPDDTVNLSQLMERLERMHAANRRDAAAFEAKRGPLASEGKGTDTARARADQADTLAAERLDWNLPPQIGEYKILRLLGRGGMSTVLEARHARLKRCVALKLIRQDLAADEHYSARFNQEAASIARLDHPHVLRVHEIGEYQGRPFLALELASAGSLANHLRGQPIEPRLSAKIVRSVTIAIAYAHQQGVVHRDLKPANILLCSEATSTVIQNGTQDIVHRSENPPSPVQNHNPQLATELDSLTPKVADFGLARHLEDQTLTQTGDLLGTPSYLAPEFTRGVPTDFRDQVYGDVYSLGAILYELVTGRAPFFGSTVADTFEQVRTLEPIPPTRFCATVPRDLETICLKCLSKEPHRRYASASDLADDLDRFLAGQPIRGRRVSRMERVWKWSYRNPAIAALIGVSLLALVTMLAGALIYERRLISALEIAERNASDARHSRDRAHAAYQSARDTLDKMLDQIENRSLSQIPRIKELQQRQLEDALEFYNEIAAQQGSDPMVQYDAARAAYDAATLEEFLGQTDLARSKYRKAIDSLTLLLADDPQEANVASTLANSLVALAGVDMETLDPEESLELAHRGLAIIEPFTSGPSVPDVINESLIRTHHRLGTLYITYSGKRDGVPANEDLKRAIEHSQIAHDLIQALVLANPNDFASLQSLTKLQVNLSIMFQQIPEQFTQCERYHDLADANFAKLLDANPFDISVASDLAILRVNWAFIQDEHNQLDQALLDLADILARLEPLSAGEPNYAPARDALYRAHGVRAQILDSLHRYAESVSNWRGCVANCPIPTAVNGHRLELATALVQSGQYQVAMAEIEEIIHLEPISQNAQLLWIAATQAATAATTAQNDLLLGEQEKIQLSTQYIEAARKLLETVQALATEEQWAGWSHEIETAEPFKVIRQ